MGARYRYALDRDKRLLPIEELKPETRRLRAPYSCIGCECELVPKLGGVVAHHFAHKSEQTCAGETYLHRLAKLAFLEVYQQCLAESRPFIFSWRRAMRCNHFENELGFRCAVPQEQKIDLTKQFDRIDLERERDGFRADVLLHSTQSHKHLFMEFVVTHESSLEKRASGIPIIEIQIRNEEHVSEIARAELDSSSPRIKLLNFSQPPLLDRCKGACPTKVDVFIVHQGGKCFLTDVAAGRATSPSYYPQALRKQIRVRSKKPQASVHSGCFGATHC
jgi:hypothetical protein